MGSPLTWSDAAKLPHKAEYNSGLACTRTLEYRFEKIIPSDGIKLLAGLLALDPYKRFNALDALNHEFFKNEPIPLLPSEMPKFEESHEIDKERFKKIKNRNYTVSELKPPTEIQYDNHTESRQNTVYSSFGGERDTRYASGKSEYNYAGRLRYEQYGQKSQYEAGKLRHEQSDVYIPKGPGDHRHHQDNYDYRSHNDYNDRGDNQRSDRDRDHDRHDRWETRDNVSRQYHDNGVRDQHASPSTVNKIREAGDTFHGKYDNYNRYNERSSPDQLTKSVPSLPPKPENPSSFSSRSSFVPKISSSNSIKVAPREDRRVKLGSITIQEPKHDPMESQKENVENKEPDKKLDEEQKSANGKLVPLKPAGTKSVESVQGAVSSANLKSAKDLREISNNKEKSISKEEKDKKAENLESTKRVEPAKKSESIATRKVAAPTKVIPRAEVVRGTKVGLKI